MLTKTDKEKFDFFNSKFFHLLAQIILPITAIGISVYLFYAGKDEKELTIKGIQSTNLVETKSEISNEIAVTYKGDTVSNTVRFLIELKNTGNKSIRNQDVVRLNWIAPKDYQIVDANLVNSNGYAAVATQVIKPDTLKISISALNKATSNQISILCLSKKNKEFGESRLDAIISDCTIIDRINDFKLPKTDPFWKQVFLGNWGVQLVKSILYFIIVFAIVASIFFLIDKITDIIQKRKAQLNLQKIKPNFPLDKDSLNVKYPEYFNRTYEALSSLSKEELSVISKVHEFYEQDYPEKVELIKNMILLPREREIYEKLMESKNKDDLKSLIRWASISYTDQLLEYFQTGQISKPFL